MEKVLRYGIGHHALADVKNFSFQSIKGLHSHAIQTVAWMLQGKDSVFQVVQANVLGSWVH